MLHDLLNAADTGLLVQAVRNRALLSLPSGLAIHVVDGLPALTVDRKALGLRVAMQSAAADRMHGTAAETLCAVAVAWNKLGVPPSAEDMAAQLVAAYSARAESHEWMEDVFRGPLDPERVLDDYERVLTQAAQGKGCAT